MGTRDAKPVTSAQGHLRSPGPHVRGCWAVDLVQSEGIEPVDFVKRNVAGLSLRTLELWPEAGVLAEWLSGGRSQRFKLSAENVD